MWDTTLLKMSLVAQDLAKQLGKFLKRQRGGLTYQQFAKRLGLSDSTVHRLELGEQNVTLKTLEQIIKRLRCRVSEIFTDTP
jgi:transcriptional regulator with XRE-family HTH domain